MAGCQLLHNCTPARLYLASLFVIHQILPKQLKLEVQNHPVDPQQQRYSLQHPQHTRAVLCIGFRYHPTSRPLEDEQLPNFRLNLWDELDSTCTSTNDSDTLVGEVIAMVPFVGMEDDARELGQAREVGGKRAVQRTYRTRWRVKG